MADNRDSGKQDTADLTYDPASSGLDVMLKYLQSKSMTPTSCCFTVNPTEVARSENGFFSSSHESNYDDDVLEKPPSQGPLGQPRESDDVILDRKQFLSAELQSTPGLDKYIWLWSGDSALIYFLFKRLPPWDNPFRAQMSPFHLLNQSMLGAAIPLALYAVLGRLPLVNENEVHIFQIAETKQGLATVWLEQVWYFILLEECQLSELGREWCKVLGVDNTVGTCDMR